MRQTDLFRGTLVRLEVVDPEKVSPLIVHWSRDSEFSRLMDSDPARMFSVEKTKSWLEKLLKEEEHTGVSFMIHTLDEHHPIGFIGLDGIQWTHGNAWTGIGIGERTYWGKGYGSDAMRVLLRFAFMELNLHRVSLNVFEYNDRAIRSYEKVGFFTEGRVRESMRRESQFWDTIYMGILRHEWEASSQQ